MNKETQPILFYDDIYDALRRSIASSNKPLKEIAQIIYPGRKPETAQGLLSRALTSDNTDVHLNVEMLITIMRETQADDIINFFCDEFGFDRPIKKDRKTFEKQLNQGIRDIQGQLKLLMQIGQQIKEVRG